MGKLIGLPAWLLALAALYMPFCTAPLGGTFDGWTVMAEQAWLLLLLFGFGAALAFIRLYALSTLAAGGALVMTIYFMTTLGGLKDALAQPATGDPMADQFANMMAATVGPTWGAMVLLISAMVLAAAPFLDRRRRRPASPLHRLP